MPSVGPRLSVHRPDCSGARYPESLTLIRRWRLSGRCHRWHLLWYAAYGSHLSDRSISANRALSKPMHPHRNAPVKRPILPTLSATPWVGWSISVEVAGVEPASNTLLRQQSLASYPAFTIMFLTTIKVALGTIQPYLTSPVLDPIRTGVLAISECEFSNVTQLICFGWFRLRNLNHPTDFVCQQL